MTIALWAALAMILQDIFAVAMVQAEARSHGWRAGGLDAVSWALALVTNHYALNSLNHPSMSTRVVVILAVTAANVLGTKSGQVLGDRFFPDPNKAILAQMVADIQTLRSELAVLRARAGLPVHNPPEASP